MRGVKRVLLSSLLLFMREKMTAVTQLSTVIIGTDGDTWTYWRGC